MEIQTKYNPDSEVHFMLDNKAVVGKVSEVFTKSYINMKEPTLDIKYSVHYRYERKVDTSLGFTGNQETHVDKWLNISECLLFSSKEELLKSL